MGVSLIGGNIRPNAVRMHLRKRNITNNNNNNGLDKTNKGTKHFLRNAVFLLLVCTGLVGTYFVVCTSINRKKSSSSSGGRFDPPVEPSYPFPGPNIPSKNGRRPFSTLHPVHDLGLPFFSRPKDSRPPKALTKQQQDDDDDNHHNRTTNNNHKEHHREETTTTNVLSFPTNAWYQNMLLVRGEPTEVNRAYATPFLVDAAGPVPGIRMIAGHVDASTAVVQLNTINEYGLTVGAAPDRSSTNHKKKKDDNNNTSTSIHSKEYSVENMTPLGFTLGWVRFLSFFVLLI